jgi:hypothetical protein
MATLAAAAVARVTATVPCGCAIVPGVIEAGTDYVIFRDVGESIDSAPF